jgi:hypothetical protein
MEATELSISILEYAQKWNLTSYPVELLSDTFEPFGKFILNLKYRLDCVDAFANTMVEMLESKLNDQVRYNFLAPLHSQSCATFFRFVFRNPRGADPAT